ncbi:MAG: EAL domain-containing protein [Oceanospirillales bacterium]|nr:MAG: EAL domain-containing protein [Oceanospirillales bacterium]
MPLSARFALSLTNRLTALALVVFLVGIWSITLYATHRLQQNMVDLLGIQQFSTVSTVAAQLDGELRFRLEVLDDVAEKISPILTSDQNLLSDMIKQDTALQALFSGGVRVHNQTGSIVAQAAPFPMPLDGDYADLDYMAIALREGRTSVGRAIVERHQEAPIIAMAAPIKTENGDIIGALVGVVDLQLNSFFDTVIRSSLGETGSFLLISPQQGMTIRVSENTRLIAPLAHPGVNQMHDRFVAGYEGFGISVNEQGIEELSASKQVRYAGWFLVGSVPTNETFAPIYVMQKQVLLSAAFVSVLFGIFVALLVRRILRRQFAPMLIATEKLSDMNQPTDELFAPLPVIKNDEVGRLINGFNKLLSRLELARSDLREQELHYRTLANGGSALIWTTGVNGLCDYVNKPWLRFTGRRLDQELGYGLMDNIHPEDINRCKTTYGDAFEDRRHFSLEYRMRHVDKSYHWVRTDASPRFDSKGSFIGYIGFCYDISAIKQYQDQLEHVAHYDVLTGLPNRILLLDRLTVAMKQATRRNQLIAIAYLDLDGFKEINDIHGHKVGDHLLIKQAQVMKEVLRQGDTLGRLGGDEFVAILVDLPDKEFCFPILQRLLEVVSLPATIDDAVLQLTASMGVTFYPQSEVTDADLLFRQADQAMYQAKQTGKNRYQIFDDEHDRRLRDRHETIEHIRLALFRDEFVLHYQPKVNMRTGQIIGAEALIRWQHPEKGLLPPAAFLPFIEENRLVIDIGEWVIDTALNQIEAWSKIGLSISVSVNVDALQLQHPDFVSHLRSLLASHPSVKAGSLELEVLETGALEDIGGVSQVMRACQEMGVGFALDDFGTGYSSLLYLKQLPANLLKVDQTFVRDMLEDPDDLAILEGVLGLAAAFRRKTIAEGVETLEHGEMLLRLGCEWAQGYAIAKPMSAQDFQHWAATWDAPPNWKNIQPTTRERLPALYAAVDHHSWVSATVNFVNGCRNHVPDQDERTFRFSRWLTEIARTLNYDQADLDEVDSLHRQVKRLAKEMIEQKLLGRNEHAKASIPELLELRDSLLELLKKLY